MDSKEVASLGGHARALSLSPKRRKAIAKKAADTRWGKARKPHYRKGGGK